MVNCGKVNIWAGKGYVVRFVMQNHLDALSIPRDEDCSPLPGVGENGGHF